MTPILRSLALAAFALSATVACRGPDRREVCGEVADDYDLRSPIRERFVERCVRERWTLRKADCIVRTGDGSFQSMFCDD